MLKFLPLLLIGCVATDPEGRYQAHWTSFVNDQRASAEPPPIWASETVTIDENFTLTWEVNDDGLLDYGRAGEYGSIVLPDKVDDTGVRKSFTLYRMKTFDGFVGGAVWKKWDGSVLAATVELRY